MTTRPLLLLKRPNSTKDFLPSGVQYLDRGGLTFVQPHLLPWLNAVEASMELLWGIQSIAKMYLRFIVHTCHRLFMLILQITKDSVVRDSMLLVKFCETAKQLHSAAPEEIVQQVHSWMLTKMYNAISNEFMQDIAKISCMNNLLKRMSYYGIS